jgi:hypothetical protein
MRYQAAIEFSDEVAYLLMCKDASGDTLKKNSWALITPAFYRRRDIHPGRKRWLGIAGNPRIYSYYGGLGVGG